jgi:hypothetical protein
LTNGNETAEKIMAFVKVLFNNVQDSTQKGAKKALITNGDSTNAAARQPSVREVLTHKTRGH